jgi:hypothetical protein
MSWTLFLHIGRYRHGMTILLGPSLDSLETGLLAEYILLISYRADARGVARRVQLINAS